MVAGLDHVHNHWIISPFQLGALLVYKGIAKAMPCLMASGMYSVIGSGWWEPCLR